MKPILEEKLTHPLGTIIRKKFKKGTLNGKISSYDKEREYYMIEYEDGDSEELRHKSVERYTTTINSIEVTSENCKTTSMLYLMKQLVKC